MDSSTSRDCLKIGHRGACGYFDENTLQSITYGLHLGCQMIEIDVYQCKTGEIVVIHDDTTTRTTLRHGYVKDMTFEDLRKLKTTSGFTIPILEEVIATVYSSGIINIEIKDPKATSKVLDIIRQYENSLWSTTWNRLGNWKMSALFSIWHPNKVPGAKPETFREYLNSSSFLITSFDYEILEEVRRLDPKRKIGWIVETINEDISGVVYLLRAINCRLIVADHQKITSTIVEKLHREGIFIFVYTVNFAEDISRMKSFDVDGIISDFPDRC